MIPTVDREDVLLATLRDLLVQDFDDFEVIVVDQSSPASAAVLAVARANAGRIRYFAASFRGLPQARNLGWRRARKDIVLYIDDDIRTGPELLRAHHACYSRDGVGVVAGGIDEASGSNGSRGPTGKFHLWTATPTRNFSSTVAGWVDHAPGGNFSCLRSALEAVNGVDEQLAVGAALYEESDLVLRLKEKGYGVWFEPAARLVHLGAPSGGCRLGRDWPRYMYGLAHNRSILIYRHLRPWHRPTALFRLLLLGFSYSRTARSFRPLAATVRGIMDGSRAAGRGPLNSEAEAEECTT